MQRSLLAPALGLALLGSALFGTTAASADPNLSVTADNATIGDGSNAQAGQEVVYQVTGCTTEGGAPGYAGVYLSSAGDPADGAAADHAEARVDEEGSLTWVAGVVKTDVPAQVFIRWYCAAQPAASWDDPSMLYAAPLMTITLGDGSASNAARSTAAAPQVRVRVAAAPTAAKAKAAVRTTAATTTHATSDPNALPAVDKLNIVGPRAAQLKARTDLLDRFTSPRSFARTAAARSAAGDLHYVRSAFLALGGRTPSAKVAAGYAAQLAGGQTRVKVIEDIALSINRDPRVWNRGLLVRSTVRR